ncbi:hypothetical protein QC762_607555 [Podospora pseudocomata]|uniref:Uncharacterized protein n=1 Tax=Podospora pseudocomata TaxID=2093779 RepID=A0ABR0G8B9_9PEZI|nr:hypothetical protein QC762_607555 [Podospora pseudocomata]
MSVVSLQAALKVSGLAWPGLDNVLARRSWDQKVEKILAELRVPAGKKHMVKAITKMVEEATDFARRLRDEPEDHFGFVEMFGAHSRLGVALARASPAVVQVFENLFFAVVMARHRYLEDCFEYDKEPVKEFQLSALAKAIDQFNGAVRGFWSNTELELYMNEAADDVEIFKEEDGATTGGQQDVEMEDVRAGVEGMILNNTQDVEMGDVNAAGGSFRDCI